MPDAKNKPNQDNGSDDLDVFRIGGREYRVGDKFSPEEIQDFFRAMVEESGARSRWRRLMNPPRLRSGAP